MNNVSNCIVCDRPLSGKQRAFCCVSCKNEYFLSYNAQKARANKRKFELIAKHGGKCARCGYSFSLSALSFYDKSGESLHVDANVLANSSIVNLEKKLKHAQVLCRNCYEEMQSPHPKRHAEFISAATPGKKILKQVQDDVNIYGTRQKFEENLGHCGVKPGQTIVLGVSGGVDSMVMLDLFAQSQMKLNIIVAHMNHGARKEAISDEKLVAKLAQAHGFKYLSKSLKPQDRHSHILENVRMSSNDEEYFRDERRAFLLDCANDNKADYVALAHNANDQAETFIMNALRGSGPAGLGAMSMSDEKIIRPLLNFSRAEIEDYAVQNKLVWHEDETNKDTSYDRNYIRHRLLPMLERLNPEYLSAVERTTYLQRKIDEHFKEEAFRFIARSETTKRSRLPRFARNDEVSVEKLRRLDKPLLYEVLGLLYEKVKGDRKDLSLSHLSAIENLISDNHGTKTLDLPNNVIVTRSYDKLDFCLKKEHNTPSAPSTKKLRLGAQRFGEWGIQVEAFPKCHPEQSEGSREILRSTQNDKNTLLIDAETLKHLQVRTRKPGDTIAKKGLGGKKKLQDLFVDAKIDRAKRNSYPVIEDSIKGEILWVPGLAKSEYKPKSNTDLYQITLEEVEHETKKD